MPYVPRDGAAALFHIFVLRNTPLRRPPPTPPPPPSARRLFIVPPPPPSTSVIATTATTTSRPTDRLSADAPLFQSWRSTRCLHYCVVRHSSSVGVRMYWCGSCTTRKSLRRPTDRLSGGRQDEVDGATTAAGFVIAATTKH